MWLSLAATSALFLGVYNIFKKTALTDNAVIPTLFFATLSGAILFIPLVIFSTFTPELLKNIGLFIPQAELKGHLMFLLKSAIVGSSWMFAYFAQKHLPISISAPIRASSPIWTLLGAIIIFGEILNIGQWIGISVTFFSYYIFSIIGAKEGIHFHKNIWVLFIVIASIIGAISSLYDKYLMSLYPRLTIQSYSLFYLSAIYFLIYIFIWYPKREKSTPFKWKYSIFLIGITLAIADFAYFYALSYEGSMISIISIIRRSNVIVATLLGSVIFKERFKLQKIPAIIGIVIGLTIIIISKNMVFS